MSKNFTNDFLESCKAFFEPVGGFISWISMNPGAIFLLTISAIITVGFTFGNLEKETSDKEYRKLAVEYCMEVYQKPVKTLVIHKYFSATVTCQAGWDSYMVLDQYLQAKLANAGE